MTEIGQKRPKNPVKALGQWLIDNDPGYTVDPPQRGSSMFDLGSEGSYKSKMAEKREQRQREKLAADAGNLKNQKRMKIAMPKNGSGNSNIFLGQN
jgi:hypothetical protein